MTANAFAIADFYQNKKKKWKKLKIDCHGSFCRFSHCYVQTMALGTTLTMHIMTLGYVEQKYVSYGLYFLFTPTKNKIS